MNSICRLRAAGLARIAPPERGTNPPKLATPQWLSVRLTSRTVCSASLRPLTQCVVGREPRVA